MGNIAPAPSGPSRYFAQLQIECANLPVKLPSRSSPSEKQAGADRVVLSTDLGQVDRMSPAEGLARLAAGLMAEGVSREDVETAMKRNPGRLTAR